MMLYAQVVVSVPSLCVVSSQQATSTEGSTAEELEGDQSMVSEVDADQSMEADQGVVSTLVSTTHASCLNNSKHS